MDINIPEKVKSQMKDGERIVGYMKNIWLEEIFFTKFGCHTTEGCKNYIYRSGNDYKREDISEADPCDFEKYERRFIGAFLWN